jgi:hypothetical protein
MPTGSAAMYLDLDTRRRWCTALLVGRLPYLWQRVASVSRGLALAQLELQRGDRVLALDEAVAPIGWDEEIRARVGEEGEVVVIDIRDRVLNMMRADEIPQWEWNETHNQADG